MLNRVELNLGAYEPKLVAPGVGIWKYQNPLPLTTDGHLRIIFLGVGAAFSNKMFQANIIIVKGETALFVDLGTKATLKLAEFGRSVHDVKDLLVTHSHADHIGSVEELALKRRYEAPFIEESQGQRRGVRALHGPHPRRAQQRQVPAQPLRPALLFAGVVGLVVAWWTGLQRGDRPGRPQGRDAHGSLLQPQAAEEVGWLRRRLLGAAHRRHPDPDLRHQAHPGCHGPCHREHVQRGYRHRRPRVLLWRHQVRRGHDDALRRRVRAPVPRLPALPRGSARVLRRPQTPARRRAPEDAAVPPDRRHARHRRQEGRLHGLRRARAGGLRLPGLKGGEEQKN